MLTGRANMGFVQKPGDTPGFMVLMEKIWEIIKQPILKLYQYFQHLSRFWNVTKGSIGTSLNHCGYDISTTTWRWCWKNNFTGCFSTLGTFSFFLETFPWLRASQEGVGKRLTCMNSFRPLMAWILNKNVNFPSKWFLQDNFGRHMAISSLFSCWFSEDSIYKYKHSSICSRNEVAKGMQQQEINKHKLKRAASSKEPSS